MTVTFGEQAGMANTLLTIPNLITAARFVAVPIIAVAMIYGSWMVAFVLFVLAGISDAVDGYIARNYQQHTRIGAYLDPLADKSLTIAVYSVLVVQGLLPGWLLVLIILRDVSIVIGAAILTLRRQSQAIRPLFVSKLNTATLIILAAWILGANAFEIDGEAITGMLVATVAVLTALSAAAYGNLLAQKFRHPAGKTPSALKQPDGTK